jgi:hypothetical protein
MKLLCIGDIAIIENGIPKWQWMPPANVIPGKEMKVLFNWELPIGNSINPVPRTSGPRLLSHPDSVNIIEKWAPGIAALATNHILDAGEKGLVETIAAIQKAGFQTIGAGQSVDEIHRPLIWETNEGRLAIINWVFPETHPDWMAVPGPNCWPGVEAVEQIIQDLKKLVDWVLVFVHWSDELFPYPRPEDRLVARALAQMGADIIVGHHPHVVRGMEVIGSCPVFYSIGNYYFSDFPDPKDRRVVKQTPRNRESLGLLLSFKHGVKPQYQIVPFWSNRSQVVSDPIRRAARRFVAVSQPLQQLDGNQYTGWHKIQWQRFNRWGYRMHFGLWQLSIRGVTRRATRLLNIILRP